MKIGFDISQTGKKKAGCGFFADSLIRNISQLDTENQYLLFPTFGDLYWDPKGLKQTCDIDKGNFLRHRGHSDFSESKEFWTQGGESLEEKIGPLDILHANNFYCPHNLKNIKTVYTLYDLSFLDHPEWTTEENRAGCFSGVFKASINADYIIAISNYSRDHFLQIFPHYPKERISVIYPASRFTKPLEILTPKGFESLSQHKFWLYLGTLEPRKNLYRLLEAYGRVKKSVDENYPLVIAGGQGWLMEDFQKKLESLGLSNDVVLLNYVDELQLQWLYQNCFTFLYPSLFEGFGMPVLEAMNLGAAVISSKVTSIPEIVDGSGILVDPTSINSIEKGMKKIYKDEKIRENMKQKAMERASLFSWQKSAKETISVYEKVMLMPKY